MGGMRRVKATALLKPACGERKERRKQSDDFKYLSYQEIEPGDTVIGSDWRGYLFVCLFLRQFWVHNYIAFKN